MNNFIDASSEIAVASYGEGNRAPLVLLHSLAMDQRMWTPKTIELFGADRELLLCDLPGHGKSPLKDSLTIESIADRISILMNSLGFGNAYVVGISLGGCVAQALAIQHGNQIRGLGLVDTTSGYHAPGAWKGRAQIARSEGFSALAEFQAERWFTKGYLARKPDEVTRLLGIFAEMDIDNYEAICAAMGAVNLTDRLGLISVPTAIAVGAEDYATPLSHAQILQKGIAGASLDVLENASHLSVIEQPDAVFRAIASVL